MSATIEWESPADAAGWTMFPNVVLLDESLSVQARMTYALLAYYARQDGACFPGQGRLAEKLGVTTRSVHTYIGELVAAMLIRVEQRGHRQTNRYVFLALGLRAKRLADRKSASDHGDRKSASAMTGSLLPTDVEAGTKTQQQEVVRARDVVKFGGKPVKPEPWEMTGRVLEAFNARAGTKKRLLTSAGQPSEAAKRIYSRLVAYPDLTFDEHVSIIERTLASKWWWKGRTSGDPPTIGVVFGPDVFEENITRPGVQMTNGKARTPEDAAAQDSRAAAVAAVIANMEGTAA